MAKAEARANAKLVALAHAIQATVAESRGLPGASARERFKEVVLNALAAEKLALEEIALEPENTSIAEPAAEPTATPDDADGVLVDWVPAALVESTSTANNELPRHQLTWRSTGSYTKRSCSAGIRRSGLGSAAIFGKRSART